MRMRDFTKQKSSFWEHPDLCLPDHMGIAENSSYSGLRGDEQLTFKN